MKKVFTIIISISLILTLVPASAVLAKSPKTEFDVNGPHFNLNLIGKKADWHGNGGEGHTIMIPQYTEGFSYTAPDGTLVEESVKIEIGQDKQADDIYVTDGNALDDGIAGLMMPDRQYQVFIVSRGKPGGTSNIDAKVWYDGLTNDYLFSVGTVSVTRNWKDATDLFWVDPSEEEISDDLLAPITEPMWIFDYLDYLAGLEEGDQDSEYYWDVDNNGNKLIQVRFYPVN